MSPRHTAPLLLALLVSCSAPSSPSSFRGVSPRNPGTIFAALDLPAPSGTRNGAGAPGPDYWQQRADYKIQATFEPETRAITGSALVRYTNNSPDALDYLWIHLEQNVFRDDSLGSQLASRGAIPMKRSEGEGITIERLSTLAGQELPLTIYDTLGRIDLPTPLPAQGGGDPVRDRLELRAAREGLSALRHREGLPGHDL